jgi:hypothetical protein
LGDESLECNGNGGDDLILIVLDGLIALLRKEHALDIVLFTVNWLVIMHER